MKIQPPVPIIKAVVVAAIVGVLGWIGLDLPREVVEESVDQQFETWEAGRDAPVADESAWAYSSATYTATITSVIDGDTAVAAVQGKEERLRFIGIDTPETADSPAGYECYADEATARATELLANQTVTLTADPTQATRDQYDRLLVYATLPTGLDFGETMITEGFAREYTYAAPYALQSRYQQAQDQARAALRGLWRECS